MVAARKLDASFGAEVTGIDFFRRIRKGYHQIMEQNKDRCVKINGDQSQRKIFKEINQIILKRFEKELTCS